MPSVSKKQQKFMGIVRSIQKGEQPASKFSKDAQDAAKSMKKGSVKKYAKTKHDDLPAKVSENTKAELYKMYTKAMKIMPGSPSQKALIKKIDALRKKLGMNEAMSASQIKKMRDEFDKTGELPPHLKKVAKGKKEFEKKFKVKDIEIPGLEWMSKLAEERDYKAEYKKFQSSTKAKKYRAELNQYNRKKGTYGNGDGKDASHKGGKIVGFEAESKNRGRAEKSRLKKEAKTASIDGEQLMNFLMKRFKYNKKQAIATMKKHKMDTSFLKKESPDFNPMIDTILDEVIDEHQINESTAQMMKLYNDLDKKFPKYDYKKISDFNKLDKYLKTKFSKGSSLPDVVASFYGDYKGGQDMKKNINQLINYTKKMKEGFGGDLKGGEKGKFEKARKENAEQLGYKVTGTRDIKVESVNEARRAGYDKSYLDNAKKKLKVPHEITDIEYKKTRQHDKFVKISYKLKWKPGTRLDTEEKDVNVFYDSPERLKMIGKTLKLKLKESVKESDLGLTYKRGKTVKVKHKKSGKTLVIVDKPVVRKEYEKIGYFAESVNEKVDPEMKKIYQLLIKYGNNAKDAAAMIKKNLKYVNKAYRNSSIRDKAVVLVGLSGIGESVNEKMNPEQYHKYMQYVFDTQFKTPEERKMKKSIIKKINVAQKKKGLSVFKESVKEAVKLRGKSKGTISHLGMPKASKGVEKLFKIADEGYGKVGGQTVDSMSANLFKQLYNKASDDIKIKLNKKNEKQLVMIIGRMWNKFGKNVKIGSGL